MRTRLPTISSRKTVGNFVDLAGIATLHVSPLWILAIVSDVAYGSTTYVRELAAELKQQGLIDDASTIHHVDDVLKAVQRASGQAAGLFDTPPLSLDQLKSSLNETRQAMQSADYKSILPESELKRYWQEMQEISKREGVSLLGVSGAASLYALDKFTNVARGTFTGVQVAGSLVNRNVIGHYTAALATLKERGIYASLRETAGPYIEAVWSNFAGDKSTLTEDVVTGRAIAHIPQNIGLVWREDVGCRCNPRPACCRRCDFPGICRDTTGEASRPVNWWKRDYRPTAGFSKMPPVFNRAGCHALTPRLRRGAGEHAYPSLCSEKAWHAAVFKGSIAGAETHMDGGTRPRVKQKGALIASAVVFALAAGCGTQGMGPNRGAGIPPANVRSMSYTGGPNGFAPGTGKSVDAELQRVPRMPPESVMPVPPPSPSAQYHEVSPGETLSGIASHYRIPVDQLQRQNGLDANPILQPGQLLFISK